MKHANQFLKINFKDENFSFGVFHDKISSDDKYIQKYEQNFLINYVWNTIKAGLKIFGVNYKYIGYSNSQFKDHSVWMINYDNSEEYEEGKFKRYTGHSMYRKILHSYGHVPKIIDQNEK